MMKRLAAVTAIGLATIIGVGVGAGGCATSDGGSRVIVLVSPDGKLSSQGFTLAQDDLPAFAKEIGDRHVLIVPSNTPSYGKAVEARDALKKAGVARVSIGDEDN